MLFPFLDPDVSTGRGDKGSLACLLDPPGRWLAKANQIKVANLEDWGGSLVWGFQSVCGGCFDFYKEEGEQAVERYWVSWGGFGGLGEDGRCVRGCWLVRWRG